MFHGEIVGVLHQLVSWLLMPVIFGLFITLMLLLVECGFALAERYRTLAIYQQGSLIGFEAYASKRLERSDLLARCGPILGLMGTLIPLGPGLNALGDGDITILATALSIAFDTTVIGLLVGLVAFIIGRLRRRWYDATWHAMSRPE